MANLITFARVIFALLALFMIEIQCSIAIFLIAFCMLLDALDGYVARHLQTTSMQGSIFDILADRIIENIFMIFFAMHSLVNVWLTLIFIMRGLTIDAVRTIFVSLDKTAFGESTLHSTKWAKFLACSRLSRGSYNFFKMITFMIFAILLLPEGIALKYLDYNLLKISSSFCLGITITLSLLRALPVIIEGYVALRANKFTERKFQKIVYDDSL